jgi:hypothetical protein
VTATNPGGREHKVSGPPPAAAEAGKLTPEEEDAPVSNDNNAAEVKAALSRLTRCLRRA